VRRRNNVHDIIAELNHGPSEFADRIVTPISFQIGSQYVLEKMTGFRHILRSYVHLDQASDFVGHFRTPFPRYYTVGLTANF
jgi:hypothetical protein